MVSYGVNAMVPNSILFGIAVLVSTARIYHRIRPVRLLKWDDYTCMVSMVITLAWFSLSITLYALGRGVENYVPNPWIYKPMSKAHGILWIWGLNMIRISMGFMLLRLKDSRKWKWSLRILITINAFLALAATAMQLAKCWPISSEWKPTPGSKCISKGSFEVYGFTYSGMSITSDLVLSLMPLTFIWGMHRSRLEKVLLGFLMGAGLIATGASIARVVLILPKFGLRSAWSYVVNDLLWGIELTIGIIAASLPSLRAPAHKMLKRLGICHSNNAADASPESFLDHMPHGSHIIRQMDGIALQDQGKEHFTPSLSNLNRPFGAPGHALEVVESRNTDATSLRGDSGTKKFGKDFVWCYGLLGLFQRWAPDCGFLAWAVLRWRTKVAC